MDERKARRAALALAVAAALTWAALRPGQNVSHTPIAATPASEPAEPVAQAPKPAPERKTPKLAVKPEETRGAGLRDPGEALGGKAPERIERSTSPVRGR